MKKQITLVAAVIIALLMFSCKGLKGPAGPEGSSPETGWLVKTYQQGVDSFTGCYDVRMWSLNPDTAYGTNTTSWVGRESGYNKRMIIEFYPGASSLPTGAVIEKTTLSLKTVNVIQGNPSFTFYEMDTSWLEASATWNSRNGTNAWVTPGGDFVMTPVSNSVRIDEYYTWYTWTINKSLIEQKIASSTSTYGFIMVADAETATYNSQAQFYNKEDTTAANRPVLTIYYSLP